MINKTLALILISLLLVSCYGKPSPKSAYWINTTDYGVPVKSAQQIQDSVHVKKTKFDANKVYTAPTMCQWCYLLDQELSVSTKRTYFLRGIENSKGYVTHRLFINFNYTSEDSHDHSISLVGGSELSLRDVNNDIDCSYRPCLHLYKYYVEIPDYLLNNSRESGLEFVVNKYHYSRTHLTPIGRIKFKINPLYIDGYLQAVGITTF
jgi:hypothetical protein